MYVLILCFASHYYTTHRRFGNLTRSCADQNKRVDGDHLQHATADRLMKSLEHCVAFFDESKSNFKL